MVPEMEKPRVTEIKVRMDCNGCVQKIKKAINGISGIYDIFIDFPEQKITIIGWADPHQLVKAIKKTRKNAIISVHTEQSDDQPAQPTEPEGVAAPEGGAPPPPPVSTNPPAEPTQTESTPTEKAPIKQPKPENSPPESAFTASQSHQDSKPKDHEDVHVIYHRPPDYGYGYGGQWNGYNGGPAFRGEPTQPPQPVKVGQWSSYHGGPEFRGKPSQPPQPIHAGQWNGYHGGPEFRGYHGGPEFRGEPSQPPQPIHAGQWNGYHGGPEFRGEPSQLPQPVHIGQWNGYHGGPVFRGEPSHPPQPVYVNHSYNTSTVHHGGPGFRGEPSHPPQPVYVTHSYSTYKPSPYVTEYIHPRSPTTYSFYNRPDNYSQDYYRNYGNSNITSMLSDENPNACRIV